MRILANYGYKTNGDTYSVTFETIGDVPPTQAPQTVDDLFRLAKEAVQRQVTGGTSQAPAVPQPATVSSIPAVVPHASAINGNGKKPHIKDPALPATSKQLGLLRRLARQKGKSFDDLTDMTMGEASAKIEEFMAI